MNKFIRARLLNPLQRQNFHHAWRRSCRVSGFFAKALTGRAAAGAYVVFPLVALAGWAILITGAAGRPWLLLESLILFIALLFIAAFDALYFLIPGRCLLFLTFVDVAHEFLSGAGNLTQHAAAALAGYIAFRLTDQAYQYFRHEPGLGQGDARLLAVAGLWVGFDGLASCVVYAVISALVSVVIMLRRAPPLHARTAIPFGPHLACGFWLVWTVGPIAIV